ncbi:MAG: hypothetical protein V7641_5471 [Blastocatellia bacterium]
MKLLSLPEAERSMDIDIKLTSVRASAYRMFGSSKRIPDAELAIVDLRDGAQPDDFETRFKVLERHPGKAILLVRRLV